MLKLNLNSQRLPMGGHHFREKGYMMKGENLAEVVKKVESFRLDNHHPIGNPEQDVLFYYAVHFPWMVVYDEEDEPDFDVDYKDWRAWLHKIWMLPPKKMVTTKEASLRWDICKNCPFNQPIDFDDGPEFDQLKRKSLLLRRGAQIPKELGYCILHRADLPVFTFIETPSAHSGKEKDTQNYSSCWV